MAAGARAGLQPARRIRLSCWAKLQRHATLRRPCLRACVLSSVARAHRPFAGCNVLNSQVKLTEEWRSADARKAAARACDACGRVALARILRGGQGSMTKSDLLFLARLWGYKCDIWQPIADGGNMAERMRVAEAKLVLQLAAASSDMVVDGEDAAGAAGPGACAATVLIWRCLDPAHAADCARCVQAAACAVPTRDLMAPLDAFTPQVHAHAHAERGGRIRAVLRRPLRCAATP